VRVEARRTDSSIEITVSDTGVGIASDFLPFIFERFRQQDSSTRRDHGGLGLGLAIVKNLVELHGGTVSAASGGLDKGSQFTVRLPAATTQPDAGLPTTVASGDADALRSSLQKSPSGLVEPVSLKDVKVLVVDDDPDARVLLRRLLRTAGAQTVEAPDVASALAAVETFHPHVLVSDIGMAHSDGYDLIRKLRAREEENEPLPAIALTAFARSEDRAQALKVGFQLHLGKPVDPDELLIAIASLTTDRPQSS
jgi:CheY-like chemotaxis protein